MNLCKRMSIVLPMVMVFVSLQAQDLKGTDTAPVPDTSALQTESSAGIVHLGAVLGAPSGIAVIGGLDLGPVSLRLSGGSWGKNWNGAQADLSFNVIQGPSLDVGLGVLGGEFQNIVSTDFSGNHYASQRYYGLALDVSLAGFLLQTGLASGPGEYRNPQFTFQFGYWWTF